MKGFVKETIKKYEQGLILRKEVDLILERKEIHGAWSLNSESKHLFIGFDYKNQNWIEIFNTL